MAGKRAAVIGSAGGIGQACAAAFADAGWEVLGADLNPPPSDDRLDVTNEDAVAAFGKKAGAVDAMVYAAGAVATMPIASTDFSVWRRIMAVNLDGGAYAASSFARQMADQGGSMVFISSVAGIRGEANASAYCASKAGLIALVESIAAELVPQNIRVNAVAPGNVDTRMLREVAQGIADAEDRDEGDVWTGLAHTGAADRIIAADEVARVCLALCEDGFSAVTGTTIPVDAGYLLS